ncbi:L-asparaginase [Hazenella coriacea]|uniref:L-asparaginase n=2 Tax=Hazenella coriacea TaxID=1179467 RepID=A0A4R3L400_9BACL|nr:L-asparaginase [Hazenella coriacea]
MAENEDSQGVKPQDPTSLQTVLPLLSRYAEVEMEHLFNIPSPHMTPQHMYTLATEVNKRLQQPDISGVVVTHGTDTLEETAYFLNLVIDPPKTVVVTGAMRSQNELGSDGPYNLVNAVRVATHSKARGHGTLVVFNDEIHAAKTVTKTHTSSVATFQSPSLGPIGFVTKKEIFFQHHLKREPTLPLQPPTANVSLIKTVAGMDDQMIQWALKQNADGIVIEAFGQGNVPPAMLPGIRQALANEVPIVLVSRCFNGIVQDTYEYEGGGKTLKEMGLIFSNGINGPKARIKLILALNKTKNFAQLQSYFQQ